MDKEKRRLVISVKPKKKSKVGLARYIDDMAEEDDEELDEKNIESARFEKEDKDVRLEIERQDRRRNQESLFEGADADVVDVVHSLHERYRRTTQLANDLDGVHEGMPCADDASRSARQEATRQVNAPSLTDPRLWLVPCKTGCECQAVISLINKCIARAEQKAGIRSAMSTGLSGFIYVESRSEAAAYETIKGLKLLRGWSMKMVPTGDMMTVVTTDLPTAQSGVRRRVPKVGDWARVSRDKYRNDLCRIVSLGDGGSSAVIKLVPRISLASHLTEIFANGHEVRPPKRPFNVGEVVAAGGNVSQRKFHLNANAGAASRNWALADNTFDIYENASYLEGFLYKEVNIKSMLQAVDANPTLDELQRFAVDTRENGACKASLAAQMEQVVTGSEAESESGSMHKVPLFAPNDKVFLRREVESVSYNLYKRSLGRSG